MRQILLISSVLLLVTSCEREAARWDVDVALPIAQGTLALNDFDADEYLSVDDDGLLHLMVEENLTDLNIEDLAALPDTTVIKTFQSPLPGSFNLPPGTNFITLTESIDLDVPGAELKRVIANGGLLNYSIRNYVDGAVDLTYNLPGVSLDSENLLLEANLPAGSTDAPSITDGQIELSGYDFDLTGEFGAAFNEILTELDILISESNTSSVQISSADSVAIWMEFISPEVQYASGYFGQHTYDFNESVSIQGAENVTASGLDVAGVEVDFRLENYVGVDAQVTFQNLLAINTASSLETALENTELEEVINITRAVDNNGFINPTVTEIALNEGNSNVDAFLETAPDAYAIIGEIDVNPLGDISGGNDFIYTAQPLNAILAADIPLCIGLDNLSFSDTLEIAEHDVEQVWGRIEVDILNYSGFEGQFAADIINPLGEVLGSLEINEGFLAAIPGTDPIPVLSTFSIVVPRDLSSDIQAPNAVLMRFELSTPNGPAKVYDTALMDVKVRGFLTAEVSIE